MDQNINLEKIERKVYLTYHKDGIWDICLGLVFLIFAFSILYNQAIYGAFFIPVFLPIIIGLKKSFTLPRLGYAKFSPERQKKEQSAISKLVVLFTFTFLAGLVAFWGYLGGSDLQQLIRDLRLIPLGAVLALSIGVIGALYGIWRFIGYGVLIIVLFVAGHFLNSDPPAYMIILGVIFLLTGSVMMIRFMKNYPKPKYDGFNHDFQ